MVDYFYVTVGSGPKYIRDFTKPSVQSLLRSGISCDQIHVVGNTKDDMEMIHEQLPNIKYTYQASQSLNNVKWTSFNFKRRYSYLKSAALSKFFNTYEPYKHMVYFDGDVLWYSNPEPFFDKKCEKTWFHHGKDLQKKASIKRKKVKLGSFKSLKQWCSDPMAYLLAEHGAEYLPSREVVAGLCLLHPNDRKKILKKTFEFCNENKIKFVDHEGAGDQKPMNAALAHLGIDWHGGSKFFCPEHKEYFDHFFGKDKEKEEFWRLAKEMGCL